MKFLFSLLVCSALLCSFAGAASVVKGVLYQKDIPGNLMDFYLPKGDGPFPTVLLVHGGGWVGGERAGSREVAVAQSLVEAGFAVASIDYRLAPGGVWPAQLDDVNSALRFLAANAGKYHLDMQRVALFGGSAGGHLVLMAAYSQDPKLNLPKIRAVVAFYPITDLLTRRETDAEGKSSEKIKESTGIQLLGCRLTGHEELWKSASPSAHVSEASPPTFLAHGLKDTLVNWEQTAELASILDAKHVPHQVIYLGQAGHTFDFVSWKGKPLETNLTPLVVSFLKQYLP